MDLFTTGLLFLAAGCACFALRSLILAVLDTRARGS
jgi:hypothetical protein